MNRPAFHFKFLFTGMILTALVFFGASIPSTLHAEEAKAPEPRTVIRALMAERLANLTTATWKADVWMRAGKKEQHTVTHVFWSADGRVRVDVVDKDNKGSTAVLVDDTVTGFKRGMLSFAKLSFDFENKQVKSVRGHSMKTTGFVDDFKAFIAQDGARVESLTDTEAIIEYAGDQGYPTRMWIRLPDLHPHKMEVRENGEVVEKHRFWDLVYQAELPDDIFNP